MFKLHFCTCTSFSTQKVVFITWEIHTVNKTFCSVHCFTLSCYPVCFVVVFFFLFSGVLCLRSELCPICLCTNCEAPGLPIMHLLSVASLFHQHSLPKPSVVQRHFFYLFLFFLNFTLLHKLLTLGGGASRYFLVTAWRLLFWRTLSSFGWTNKTLPS